MKRLLVLAFIWGWSFLFIKVAVEGMTPTTVAAARIGLGALTLQLVLRRRGLRLPTDRTMWRHFAVAALVGSVIPFTMLAWGEERITSALTAVLNASTPLFTAMAGAAVLGERLRTIQATGLLVGLAGVGVAAGVGGSDLAHSSLAGSAAAVGAGACYGLAFAYMKRHLMDVPAVVAATGQLTAGVVMLAPFAIVTTATNGFDPAPHRLLSIVLLGVLGTGLAYVLNYQVIAELGATKASLVTYIIPVVAVAVGVVVLGEELHLRLLLGGVLVVAGIALVHRRLRLPRSGRATPIGAGPVTLVLVALAVLGGCGAGQDPSLEGPIPTADATTTTREPLACGPVRTEPQDPGSSVHVLPGAEEPPYTTDPPTSGPHLTGALPTGVVDEPLDRPTQVAVLEQGGVLLQHRDLPDEQRSSLEGLAGDQVVVAPNPTLPAPVVATAWTTKQTCQVVDVAVLEGFVADHQGQGPGAAGH